MKQSLQRWRIIWLLAAVLALGGCSALRLGYSQGPELMDWWLDGYVDFTDEQAPRVREALRDWFGWHRGTQLPEYASLLARIQDQLQQPVTAEAACELQREAVGLIDIALDRALPAAAVFAVELNQRQLSHLQQRLDKVNDEFRDEFLQPDLDDRRRATRKRARERSERLYGPLDETQLALIAEGLAASPFDPDLWLAERVARQNDLLRVLRSTADDRARMQAALRGLADDVLQSPRPAYRAYQQQLNQYNCRLFSRLHATTSAAQRQHARETLKAWEDDLRALVAAR